jgi:hypothetical protein
METDGAQAIFENEGIKIDFMEVNLFNYPQLFGKFIPDLSIIDFLFNCGPDSSKMLFDKDTAILDRSGSE